jgi:ABC-2 type transport system ATP-binding protein
VSDRRSEPLIHAHGLRKRYDGRDVVGGIDLDVSAGEVFAFLGPNGAGKTTTVEILEGYRDRDGGEVRVLGEDPETAGRHWRARIGVVLQSCTMPAELTVRELVELYAAYFPAPRPVGETIELAGLADQRDLRVGRLSGGQRRRLDVALALIGDPELVFLDEPTTGFDPSARHHAWDVIRNLSSIGKTVFLTTHYMEEAEALADRVAVIARGSIVAQGPKDALGGRDTAPTDIAFRCPPGLRPADLPGALAPVAGLDDGHIHLQTAHTASTLHTLAGWALERGFELEDLTVGRPTLEDVYLRLTEERGAPP